jgi:hypothetical protein
MIAHHLTAIVSEKPRWYVRPWSLHVVSTAAIQQQLQYPVSFKKDAFMYKLEQPLQAPSTATDFFMLPLFRIELTQPTTQAFCANWQHSLQHHPGWQPWLVRVMENQT